MTDNGFPMNRRRVLGGLAAGALAGPLLACNAEAQAQQRTAVVIGAGIAGLSAAHDLTQAGFAVSIFEKWDFVGGRMRETWRGPLYGPTHAIGVFDANADMFALAEEVGIAEQMKGVGVSDAFRITNTAGTYDSGLRFNVDEVAAIPGLSSETRRALPRLRGDLEEIAATVDPCMWTTGTAWDTESLADYYRRALGPQAGQEIVDNWIDPVLLAFGMSAEEVSATTMLALFAQQGAEFRVPAGGIGILTSTLGDMLDVQTRTTVRYITPPAPDGRRTIHYLNEEHERMSITPDVVVLATEGKYVASLVQDLPAHEAAFFSDIKFTKAAGATFVFKEGREPETSDGGGYIPTFPDAIKRKVGAWSVSPGDPAADVPATASIYLNRTDFNNWQQSGQTQQDYCFDLLSHFYPAARRDDIADQVVVGCDDLVNMPVGYLTQAARILDAQEAGRRSLYFAGEYLAGCHTGAACASGRRAARTIVKHWI
ncbi:MAG: FAD-dependent oxidoreductase [Pacificimonas sp.]|jgi:oxygen-dependent protoporphyrinogen oxidase|nr:FAD-dependent oxidoreductase [Pacificimonas sp.]